jgi:hypothetical protein
MERHRREITDKGRPGVYIYEKGKQWCGLAVDNFLLLLLSLWFDIVSE